MTTPTQKSQQQKQKQKQQQQPPRYSAHEAFTPEMRDRQARGKDPYTKSDDGSDDDDDDDEYRQRMMRPGHGSTTEPFEERERRAFALSVLDSPEQLIMYAQSTGDSIPGQRQRFAAMLCGFDPPPPSERKTGGNSSSSGASSRRDAQGRRANERAGR